MKHLYRSLIFLLLLGLTACGGKLHLVIEFPTQRATAIQTSPAPTASSSSTATSTRTPTSTASPTLRPSATASSTASPTATQSVPNVTTLVNLNLRGAATINSTILEVIPANTTIQLFGRSADSAWLRVQYGQRLGWVSSASNLVRINGASLSSLPVVSVTPTTTPTAEDATPTRETRIGFNINGEAVPSISTLHNITTSPCTSFNLVMNSLSLAVQLKERCPDMIVVSRNYSPLEGDEWAKRSAKEIVAQWITEGHREIVRHSTNEPSFGPATVGKFIAAEIELMKLARANGFTLAVGNFSVGIIQPHDISNGVWDGYIRAIIQYRHYLGLHEYAVVALPFGVGQWQTAYLLDRTRVQPASWPLAAALPVRYWGGELPPYWYLLRCVWWFLRADTIGVQRPQILLTEFGWDNLPNIKADIEPLRQRFGLPQYFMDMRGVNTYPLVWAWYWPQWSFAQAACEQLKWADSVYPPEVLGFANFTVSLSPDWAQTDFSGYRNPQHYELHDCLESYAYSLN